jgi:hypothetical protein
METLIKCTITEFMLCLCLMVKLNLTTSGLGHYVGLEVHDPPKVF